MFYWIFGLAHVIFILSPAMALIFGAILFSAPPTEIFLYVVPYLLAIYLSMHMLYGHVRWLFVSEIYETIQSFLTILAPLKTLISPAGKMFYVTPKEESLEHDSISTLTLNFYILISLLLLATGLGIYHLVTDAQGVEYYLVSLLWNCFNMLFVLAALGAMVELKQQRHRPRVNINEVVTVNFDGKFIPSNVENMTEDGALIRLPDWADLQNVEQGKLILHKNNAIQGNETQILGGLREIPFRVVRVHPIEEGGEKAVQIGVCFEYESVAQRRTVVAFVYGDSERWKKTLKSRNQPSSLWQGTYFLFSAVGKGLYHLKFAVTQVIKRKPVFRAAPGTDL
ncbi:MAG: hypothetical protein AUJ56_01020 [Zetaproteobacteria bacterium CG1_02_49_23]|nr:MAG: hypothetical protein AUJ56_01020 [Zetaproteobacteria bacterium CG1_02_49_23]